VPARLVHEGGAKVIQVRARVASARKHGFAGKLRVTAHDDAKRLARRMRIHDA
jgi:hypothetical protein